MPLLYPLKLSSNLLLKLPPQSQPNQSQRERPKHTKSLHSSDVTADSRNGKIHLLPTATNYTKCYSDFCGTQLCEEFFTTREINATMRNGQVRKIYHGYLHVYVVNVCKNM